MAESNRRFLFDDRDRYFKAYLIFKENLSKVDVLTTWIKTVFVDEVCSHLIFNLNENEALRTLGLGSGSGKKECTLLTELVHKYPVVKNRVVEPVWEEIDQYKALVQSKSHELQGVKFDWRQQTFEQYRNTDGEGTKFHFISAIHSMYYFGDEDSSVTYLYNLLEPGGKLLVIVVSDDSGCQKLRGYVSNLMKRHTRPHICSADIRIALEARNIPYVQTHQNDEVDITECFDEKSEAGNLLLDFLVVVSEFKKMATASQYKEVLEYLASSDCSKKDGSKILLNNDWEAIIVTKLPD